MIVREATGATISVDEPPRRIVSLVPSLTEALFAFGAGERLAGVTRFCDEPAERVRELPKVGGTKTPDVGVIVALRPDLVVASVEENRLEDVTALRGAGIAVYVTHYPTVAAAITGLTELALMAGADPGGCSWLVAARERVMKPPRRVRPLTRYFCPIWRRPYMVARRDTYMSDLLALAGGVSCYPETGSAHYFTVDLTELAAAAPDVILLPDEPYRFAPRHLEDFEGCGAVPAIASGRVHFVDGKALTWYGPRTAAAIDHFAALFDGTAVQASRATGRPSDAV